jgi:UDP-2,3-diacylglucosamine pyrophosphatase LpxH
MKTVVERKTYKTLVLSDLHLGTRFSKVEQVCDFLSKIDCDRLIFNGDTVDGWQLSKNDYQYWGPSQARFFGIIMKMIEKYGTQVYFLRGNHDDFMDKIIPMQMGPINILKDMEIESNGKKYFVTHGDVFDSITSEMKWMAKLGDVMYNLLLLINVLYNRWQALRGKPYYSFSQAIKNKVKKAVATASDFDCMLADMAKAKGCQGVICGHIHRPEDRIINGIHYLNSGDWVETLSALVEDFEGKWKVLFYKDQATAGV